MKYLNNVLLLLAIFASSNLFAQKHDNVWFVGHEYSNGFSAKLNFNNNSLQIDSFQRNMPMFRTNTSISDTIGNLEFYTNGIWIHNAQHQLIQNGDSLNPGVYADNNRAYGYNIPDGAIIIPHPKQANKYYLFHQSYEQNLANAGFGENLYYTLVDMNANNGLGIVENKNQFLVSDSICYGQLEAIKHGNGKDWWLIQPMASSNGYYTFLITEDTIVQMPKQYIGNANRIIKYEWLGQATFTPNGSKYLRFDHKNDLDIFDFNRCTGELSNYIHIPIIDSVDNLQFSSIASGVAVSSSSQYAYVSSFLNLYQFDLFSNNIAASIDTIAIYDGFTDFLSTTFSYLQLAPDDKIYGHAYSTRYLHVINNPNLNGANCDVQQHNIYTYYYNGLAYPNHPHYRTPTLTGSPCDTITNSITIKEPSLNVKIYPNPASTTMTIESGKVIEKIRIYTALGQEVFYQTKVEQLSFDVDTRSFENGTYFISIWVEGEVLNQQFQVLR